MKYPKLEQTVDHRNNVYDGRIGTNAYIITNYIVIAFCFLVVYMNICVRIVNIKYHARSPSFMARDKTAVYLIFKNNLP